MADGQPSIPRLGQWTRPPLPGLQNGRSGSPQLKDRDDVSRTDRYLSAAGIAHPTLNRDRRFCAESEPQAHGEGRRAGVVCGQRAEGTGSPAN